MNIHRETCHCGFSSFAASLVSVVNGLYKSQPVDVLCKRKVVQWLQQFTKAEQCCAVFWFHGIFYSFQYGNGDSKEILFAAFPIPRLKK